MALQPFLHLHRSEGVALTRAALERLLPQRRRATEALHRDAEGVAWILALALQRQIGGHLDNAHEVRIALDPEEMRGHLRMSRQRWDRAVEYLMSSGVLTCGGGGRKPWVRFEREALGSHPVLERLRADVVFERLRGCATAHALLWVLLETHRGDPTLPDPITLEEIRQETGYGETAVRGGMRDLETAGLLVRTERPGMPTEYRLAPVLLGGEDIHYSAAASQPPVEAPPVTVPAQTRAQVEFRATEPVKEAHLPQKVVAPDLEVEVGGHPISIAPGIPIRVSVDESGDVVYEIGPAMRIRVRPDTAR